MRKKNLRKPLLVLTFIAAVLLSISSQAAAHTTVDKENSTPQPAEIVTDLKEIRLVFKSPLIDDGKAKISLATVREGQDIPIGETTFESPTVISADTQLLQRMAISTMGDMPLNYMKRRFRACHGYL